MTTKDIKGAARPAIPRPAIHCQLRRFDGASRRRLRKLARRHRNLADLVYTFPGLAFGLVNGYGERRDRDAAVALARDGAGLKKIAAALGMPFWMRALPPETYARPFEPIRTSPEFARWIGARIPSDPDKAGAWFGFVHGAIRAEDERLAIWLAGQEELADWRFETSPVAPLAAYSWFSRRPDQAAGRRIGRPFNPSFGLPLVIGETRAWLGDILFGEARGDGPGWFSMQVVRGFRVVPLRKSAELAREGVRMNNCVASYASDVADGTSLIYSLRRGPQSVATMEIRPSYDGKGGAYIAQLYGPGNSAPSDAIVDAAKIWLARQGRYPAIASRIPVDPALCEDNWRRLFAPYREALGERCPIAGGRDARRSIIGLVRDIRELCLIEAEAVM